MEAIFYNFTKKTNSTARPTNGTTFDIVFKYPSSIHSPVLQIKAYSFNYNYCYIAQFETYYRVIETRTIAQGLWEVSLEHDLLATYRNEILNNKAYVTYASDNFNDMALDNRCVMLAPETILGSAVNLAWTRDEADRRVKGSYVLTVLAGDTSEFSTSYVLRGFQLEALADYLVNNDDWGNLLQLVNKPIDSILRLAWIPFLPLDGWGSQTTIYIGGKDTEITAHKLNTRDDLNIEVDIPISWHYDDFRRYEPYTRLSLWLPYYGAVTLNNINLINSEVVKCKYAVDLVTGDITISLGGIDGDYRQTINYNISVNLPLAQLYNNSIGVLNDILSIGGGILGGVSMALSGNPVGTVTAGLGVVKSGINLALDSQTKVTSVKGSLQGRSMYYFPDTFRVIQTYFITDDPNDYNPIKGRPVFGEYYLSGFVNAFVQAESFLEIPNALPSEVERLNSMLAEGIYLE